MLKAMTIVLADILPVSPRCTHIKRHGGAKSAVRQVDAHLAANSFVMRTDVKSFYASIDHLLLMDRLAIYVKDRGVLNLLGQTCGGPRNEADGSGTTTGEYRWAVR